MSVVKNYDKNIYPSIQDAILEILDEHLVSGFGEPGKSTPIYDHKALDEVLNFLCVNNIQHQFMVLPAPANADCDELISLVWNEPSAVGHEAWYSKGKTKKAFRVTATIIAETKEEVEDWISYVDEVDVTDWSVEEL